jgi:hypothetical protein
MHTCPVCFFDDMPYPAAEYNICPCCGTEFGNDDEGHSHAELRQQWIGGGAKWFFGEPPLGWDAWIQLRRGEGVRESSSARLAALAKP